jgi:GTP-binding protein
MRASWGPLIEGYLSRRPELRGVIQIVDLRHPPTAQDVQLYQWLKHHHLPAVVVATKADKLSKSQGLRQLLVVRQTLGLTGDDPLIKFSARTREGRDELWRVIEGWIN